MLLFRIDADLYREQIEIDQKVEKILKESMTQQQRAKEDALRKENSELKDRE